MLRRNFLKACLGSVFLPKLPEPPTGWMIVPPPEIELIELGSVVESDIFFSRGPDVWRCIADISDLFEKQTGLTDLCYGVTSSAP